MCKRAQHVTSNNAESCWQTILRPYARGFKVRARLHTWRNITENWILVPLTLCRVFVKSRPTLLKLEFLRTTSKLRKRKKTSSLLVYVPDKNVKLGIFTLYSCSDVKEIYEKSVLHVQSCRTFSLPSPSSILRSSFADDERHSFPVLWLFLALRFHCICIVSFLGFLFVYFFVCLFLSPFLLLLLLLLLFFSSEFQSILSSILSFPSTAVKRFNSALKLF